MTGKVEARTTMTMGNLVRRMAMFLWRILLTTLLMYVFTAMAPYVSTRVFQGEAGNLLLLISLSMFGVAMAGAIGIRIFHLAWRETFVSALLFEAGILLLFAFESTYMLIVAAPGVFLLPLFDPLIRKRGPAPSRGKMVLVALCLTLIIIVIDGLAAHGNNFGFLTFIIGASVSMVFAGLGAILALGNLTSVGAWLGGLGLMLFPLIMIAGRLIAGGFPMLAD